MFSGNSMWQLVRASDWMSLGVLIILLFLSVISWAIFLCKFFLFFYKKRQFTHIRSLVKRASSINEIKSLAEKHKDTLPGFFLLKNIEYISSLVHQEREHQYITIHEWERFQFHVDQMLDILVIHEESYLPMLSTTAAISPLLGLFGTVWGLIHSFVRISEAHVADIATIAPGIAEALITTLAGLMVAIPALAMYNYLMVQVRYIEQQLLLLADVMSLRVQNLIK